MDLDVEEHETTELLVGVLRELKDIKEMIARNTKQLFDLQATVDTLTNKYDDTEITFPAKTLQDFDEIEEMMKDSEGREFITLQLKSVLKNNDDMWLLKIIDEDIMDQFSVCGTAGKRNIHDYQVIKYAINYLNTNKQSLTYCMTRVRDRNKKRKSYNSKKVNDQSTIDANVVISKEEDAHEDIVEDEGHLEEQIHIQESSMDGMDIIYADNTDLYFPIKSLGELKMMEKMMTEQTSRRYLARQLKTIVEKNSQSWIVDVIDEKLLVDFTMNEKEGKRCLLHLKIIDYAINHLKASKRAASYCIRKVKDKITKRKQRVEPQDTLDDYDDSTNVDNEIVLEEDIIQQVEDHDYSEETDVKDTQIVLYIPQSSVPTTSKRKRKHFFFPAMTHDDIELMEELMVDPEHREDLIFQLEARIDRNDDMWLLKLIDDNLLVDFNTSGKMGKRNIFQLKVICYAINYLQTTKQSVSYAIRKAKDKIYHRKLYKKRLRKTNTTKEEVIVDEAEDIIEEDDKSQHYVEVDALQEAQE
ncbi:uncharacterized protein LOC129795555 [Lutzomyia longipalpis]|uniref:uncharacterized protein LOC129795555 n=1 Tax=Lutzomyia longipalpis TaxID=7200 RepID=UPI00248420DE|nr:uncharacterized protein LOC129795555 [Lutzomyia longipalpis]XP_055692921.1 uncharacterized protein LOC129795555 [Lutzomyia longipalpis]